MREFAPYIGIPFKELGRDRSGLDCYGLVRLAYHEVFRCAVRDFCDYRIDARKDCAALVRGAAREEWIKVPTPRHGDIVLLRILGHPMHCGIYLGNGEFIHASHDVGVCIERLNSTCWNRRIAGFYRHREMCDG